jgi:hypothetical protein
MVALFVIYGVGVGILFPEGGDEQNMLQANVINAQDFIFDREAAKYIIMGTSLVGRLKRSLDDDRFRMLFFQGGSALTALRLVEATGKRPQVVFIETNFLLRDGEDREFIDVLFSPVRHRLNSIMPVFREKYQPVSVFLRFFKGATGADKADFFAAARTDKASLDLMLSIKHKEFSRVPMESKVAANKILLEELVRELEARGIKIVLFELPIDPSLTDAPLMKAIRPGIKSIFPPEKYRWIRAADTGAYGTTDGLHLDTESAKKFVSLIESSLRE